MMDESAIEALAEAWWQRLQQPSAPSLRDLLIGRGIDGSRLTHDEWHRLYAAMYRRVGEGNVLVLGDGGARVERSAR
jgi:hypothetical protein